MKELLEQYQQAKSVADSLASNVYAAFMAMPTVEEKFKIVLEYGDEFLREEYWYCPRVRTSKGEVSLDNDMWIHRYQTLTLEQLVEAIYDDYDGIDWQSEDHLSQQFAHAGATVNLDTPSAAILRDMLDKGIRSGTFDW